MKIFRSKEQKKFDKFKKAYFDKKDIEMLTDDYCIVKFSKMNNKNYKKLNNLGDDDCE